MRYRSNRLIKLAPTKLLAGLTPALLGFHLLFAQSPFQDPTTRDLERSDVVLLRSDLVTVVSTVLDGAGNLITNLHAEDFEIFEDDIPQPIATFARHSDLPLSMVLIFDASLSVKSRLRFEKEALERFLLTVVRPQDQAAIISVSTDITLQQGFTASTGQLLSAINHIEARGATALYDAVSSAAQILEQTPGRRVIIIMSDGRDTISRITLTASMKRAQEVDAIVYAIGSLGTPLSSNLRELAGERALQYLARETGGQAFFPNKAEDLNPVFARLAEQLRLQYVLGYVSSNEARDGAFRRLRLKVSRPGLYARARAGYYAPKQ